MNFVRATGLSLVGSFLMTLGCVSSGIPKTMPPADFWLAPKQSDEIRVHVLNVGSGTCQIVECPGLHPDPLLIDCGSIGHSDQDMSETDAQAYIQAIAKKHAGAVNVVVSHPDEDHISYLPDVLPSKSTFRVPNLWLGGDYAKYSSSTKTWVKWHENNGTKVRKGFKAGFSNGNQPVAALACGDASTYIPTVNAGVTKNDNSLVIQLVYGDFTAILPGDATGVTQRSAVANFGKRLSVTTVLVGSHHGADTQGSNDASWAAATTPLTTIFSSGLKFYHPRCAAMAPYRGTLYSAQSHWQQCGESGEWGPSGWSKLGEFVTEDNGAVVITADQNGYRVSCSLSDCSLNELRVPLEVRPVFPAGNAP